MHDAAQVNDNIVHAGLYQGVERLYRLLRGADEALRITPEIAFAEFLQADFVADQPAHVATRLGGGLFGGLPGQNQVGEDLRRFDDFRVVAAHVVAVLFHHVELVPVHVRVYPADVAGVPVLGHQLERDLLATSANPDRYARLLYALRLVDGSSQLVMLALEAGVRLSPHRVDDFQGLPQHPQALRAVGERIAVSVIFVIVPACPDAKV